ncbi:pectinesterase inhibitor 10-like [Schistocerca americana]|uniref:pectinesterase inhibitor 10-like n=1 Tax=Schistocerca americana TaxID=7009 RepID=UPI001F503311|nr:pectinesterase inhibitor 10-like [Schistocerca americana]
MLDDDTVWTPLKSPYTGPHKIIKRTDQTLDIEVKGNLVTVSLHRVKTAYVEPTSPHPPVKDAYFSNHIHSSQSSSLISPPLAPTSRPPATCSTPSSPFRGFSPRPSLSNLSRAESSDINSSPSSSLAPSQTSLHMPGTSRYSQRSTYYPHTPVPPSPGRHKPLTPPESPFRGFSAPLPRTDQDLRPETCMIELRVDISPEDITNLSITIRGDSAYILLVKPSVSPPTSTPATSVV